MINSEPMAAEQEEVLMQIGFNAKQKIVEDLKNIESAVFAMVAAIETGIYCKHDELDIECRGADIFLPDQKSLIRILSYSVKDEIVGLHNSLNLMKEIHELS